MQENDRVTSTELDVGHFGTQDVDKLLRPARWGGAHISVASLYVKAYGARAGHAPPGPKSVPRQPDRRYGATLWLDFQGMDRLRWSAC